QKRRCHGGVYGCNHLWACTWSTYFGLYRHRQLAVVLLAWADLGRNDVTVLVHHARDICAGAHRQKSRKASRGNGKLNGNREFRVGEEDGALCTHCHHDKAIPDDHT